MRIIAFIFASVILSIVIASTGCESLYEEFTADRIYMFNAGTHDGNLKGRAGADSLCETKYNTSFSNLEANNIRAFISVSSNDEIRDMPENYGVPEDVPVESADGRRIGNDWADILDGSIQQSLYAAGILPGAISNWWSGAASSGNGSISGTRHCLNWTDSTAGPDSYFGIASDTDAFWISNSFASCNNNLYILCIAW